MILSAAPWNKWGCGGLDPHVWHLFSYYLLVYLPLRLPTC